MARINVVLSNMRGLLRDIVVHALSAEPDIDIAGEAHSAGELEELLERRMADLVVAGEQDASLVRESRHLLCERARPRLLVLSAGGSAAHLHWMKPQTRSLGELTPEGLVHAIREAALAESDCRARARED